MNNGIDVAVARGPGGTRLRARWPFIFTDLFGFDF